MPQDVHEISRADDTQHDNRFELSLDKGTSNIIPMDDPSRAKGKAPTLAADMAEQEHSCFRIQLRLNST